MGNKLVLVSLSSTEVDVDLKSWDPGSSEDVFICLDMAIGYRGQDNGTNLFYVTLATPEGLKKHCKDAASIESQSIVISKYNYEEVRGRVLAILEKCSKGSWDESCVALQEYFDWEYANYQE